MRHKTATSSTREDSSDLKALASNQKGDHPDLKPPDSGHKGDGSNSVSQQTRPLGSELSGMSVEDEEQSVFKDSGDMRTMLILDLVVCPECGAQKQWETKLNLSGDGST